MVFDPDPQLDSRALTAVASGLRGGKPSDAVATHVRWFQLETWLRQLVHLELSAAYGREWITHLASMAQRRAKLNSPNAYMLSPDEGSLLAYEDVGDLFALIEANWNFSEPSLVPRVRWAGWADELKSIRNRIAHSRRPHADDLARIEQILRNLEAGAKIALAAYEDTFVEVDDPSSVAAQWTTDAAPWGSIVDHARGRYDTYFR
jgi:uncharacterized protein YfkK (UPF0435 family)